MPNCWKTALLGACETTGGCEEICAKYHQSVEDYAVNVLEVASLCKGDTVFDDALGKCTRTCAFETNTFPTTTDTGATAAGAEVPSDTGATAAGAEVPSDTGATAAGAEVSFDNYTCITGSGPSYSAFRTTPDGSKEACMGICEADPDCKAFDWKASTTSNYACRLYDGTGVPVPQEDGGDASREYCSTVPFPSPSEFLPSVQTSTEIMAEHLASLASQEHNEAISSSLDCTGACLNEHGYYLRASPDGSQAGRRAQCCEQKTCKGESVVCPAGKKQREGFDTLLIATYTRFAEEACCVMDTPAAEGPCANREPVRQANGALGHCTQANQCWYGSNGGYAECCGGLYNAVNGALCVPNTSDEECKDGPTTC